MKKNDTLYLRFISMSTDCTVHCTAYSTLITDVSEPLLARWLVGLPYLGLDPNAIPVVIWARWLVWLYEWRWWFKCNNDITVRQYNTLDFSQNHQTPGGFWIYGSAFWHARLFIIHWRFWNCFWLNVDNVIRTSRIQSWNSPKF